MDKPVTPGPWQMTDRPNDGCCWTHHVETVERERSPLMEGLDYPKAHIADVDGEANARLLAAAPELLAAAKHILNFCEPINDESHQAIQALEAAIAKAEGRA